MSLIVIVASDTTARQACVSVKGSIDTKTAPELMDKLMEIGPDSLIELRLDFAEVTFLSSSGIRVLIYIRQKMPQEARLILDSVNDQIRTLIITTGLEQAVLLDNGPARS